MQITIAGAGYVGLVAGACYASTGNTVTFADRDVDRIEVLRAGGLPIYEPGLAELLAESVKAGRVRYTSDLTGAVAEADVIGIAVGTPPGPDGSADLSAVRAVAETIGKNLRDYCIVVTKSTVPVGTHRVVSDIIAQHTTVEFDYVSNPEFLKEGSAVDDFLRPERKFDGLEALKRQIEEDCGRARTILKLEQGQADWPASDLLPPPGGSQSFRGSCW